MSRGNSRVGTSTLNNNSTNNTNNNNNNNSRRSINRSNTDRKSQLDFPEEPVTLAEMKQLKKTNKRLKRQNKTTLAPANTPSDYLSILDLDPLFEPPEDPIPEEKDSHTVPTEKDNDNHNNQTPASPANKRRNDQQLTFDLTTEQIKEGPILGKGAYGAVYSCRLSRHPGQFAVKKIVLPPTTSKQQQQLLQQQQIQQNIQKVQQLEEIIEREIRLLSELRHENIVTILGYKREPSEYIILMQKYDDSLRQV